MNSFALRGARIWDGLADHSVEGPVVVEEGRIAAADGASDSIDVSGCTILPGLIEGHAHLCFDATPGWRATYDGDTPSRMLLRMAANGRRMLHAGITTVRDLGAPTGLSIELRDAINDGLADGPRLLVAGAPVTTTGGHCWFMGGECDGEVGIRKNVREHVKAGTDWIKVMATGGNMTPRTNTFAPQFTVPELRALIEEAHRLHRRVAAHAHGVAGIKVAVEAGVDSIEHCSFTVPTGYAPDAAVIAEIAAKGILVSPTVSIGFRNWPDDGRKQQRGAVMKALLNAGGRGGRSGRSRGRRCGSCSGLHGLEAQPVAAAAVLEECGVAFGVGHAQQVEQLGQRALGVDAAVGRAALAVVAGRAVLLARLHFVRVREGPVHQRDLGSEQ